MLKPAAWGIAALLLLPGCDGAEEPDCSTEVVTSDDFYLAACFGNELLVDPSPYAEALWLSDDPAEVQGTFRTGLSVNYPTQVPYDEFPCEPYPCISLSLNVAGRPFLTPGESIEEIDIQGLPYYGLDAELGKGAADGPYATWTLLGEDGTPRGTNRLYVAEFDTVAGIASGTFELTLQIVRPVAEEEAGFPTPETIRVTDGRFRLPLTVNDARKP